MLRSGDGGENGSAVLVATRGGVHGWAFRRLGANEEDCGGAFAVSFFRSISRLRHSGFASDRGNTGVGGCDIRLFSFHHVPPNLCFYHKESFPPDHARFITPV